MPATTLAQRMTTACGVPRFLPLRVGARSQVTGVADLQTERHRDRTGGLCVESAAMAPIQASRRDADEYALTIDP
jgi:hypothetical protein